MERKINLESLPQEVLTHIATYLDVHDVLACCSTSTSLRYAFNDNSIWKKLCNLGLVDYLSKHKSLDDPDINERQTVTTSLPPLCQWRRCYIMQASLMRNLRQGRYKKVKFVVGAKDAVFEGTSVAFCRTGEHLLFHSVDVVRDEMVDEIWNVKEAPTLHSSLCFNFDQNVPLEGEDSFDIDTFDIIGDRLVVSQHNVVQVYNLSSISSSDIKLEQAFVFDKSEEISKSLVCCKDNSFVCNYNFEVMLDVKSTICNGLFIGIVLNDEEFVPTLHMWDIVDGTKVREDVVPGQNVKIIDIWLLTSRNRTDIIVKMRVDNHRYMYHYYGYNLSTLEFSSFSVKLNYCDFSILAYDRVVGIGQRKLYLYDYKTSDKVAMRNCDHEILKNALVLLENNLLYGTFDSTIFVVKLATFEVVNTVKLGFTLYSLKVLRHGFVVINSTNSEVWEIGETAKKLFKFPTDVSYMGSNQYCTKIVVDKGNELSILHFW